MKDVLIMTEEDRQILVSQILSAPVGSTVTIVEPAKRRSLTLNRSLHLWCSMTGSNLNAAGYDARQIINDDYDISWDKEGSMVKRLLWGPVQKVITGHDSTTKPTPSQYQEIYENVNRRLPVHTPWPTR